MASRSTRRSSPRRTCPQARSRRPAANNLTFPSGQVPSDGSKIPVSTIGDIGSVDADRDMVVGVEAPAQPVATAQPAASRADARSRTPPRAVAPPGRAARPKPVTIGDLGTVEVEGVATTGFAAPDPRRRPAGAVPVGHEDLERQHRPGRRRRDREARRAGRAAHGHRLRHGRLGPVRLHQGVARRPAPRGRPRRPVRGPDDLPVPVQHPLDDRRGRQHPALDPRRARDHAGDRHHPEHHDPGRPRGRRRTRGRRRDRRPREHLPPSRHGRRPPRRPRSTARGRSPAPSPRPRSRRSACSCRSASSAASSASSSCRSR